MAQQWTRLLQAAQRWLGIGTAVSPAPLPRQARLDCVSLEDRITPTNTYNWYPTTGQFVVRLQAYSANQEFSVKQSQNNRLVVNDGAKDITFRTINPASIRAITVYGTPKDDTISLFWATANNGFSSRLNGRVTLYGSGGNDNLDGSQWGDKMYGGDGRDFVVGWDGNDYIDGGADDDFLVGFDGNDFFRGGAGDDLIQGGNGADRLYGDSGQDTLNGDAGNDILSGGTIRAEPDKINGGTGTDYWIWQKVRSGNVFVYIKTFEARIDTGDGSIEKYIRL